MQLTTTKSVLQVKAFSSALAKGGFVKLNEHRKVIHPQTFYCGEYAENFVMCILNVVNFIQLKLCY